MKQIKFLVVLSILPVSLFSQNIAETIYKIEKSYTPILSKNEAFIEMRLLKAYTKGKEDTTYSFTVRVVTKSAEAVGGASSFAFSRYAWAAGANEAYVYNKEDKFITLTPAQLKELKDGGNEVYLHTKQSTVEHVCTYSVDKLTLGAELVPGSQPYYFFAIEDAIFKMTEQDFLDLVKVIVKANSLIN